MIDPFFERPNYFKYVMSTRIGGCGRVVRVKKAYI